MLGFLNNRIEKPHKTLIRNRPDLVSGISIESPQYFQSPSTLVNQSTFLNPYLPFDQARERSLSKERARQIQPAWTRKTNLQLVEEQRVVGTQMEVSNLSPESKYHQSYHKEYNLDADRFKLKKGEFTNFLQQNTHYKSIGPLHGEQRSMERIQNTKKSVWMKPTAVNIRKHVSEHKEIEKRDMKSATRLKTDQVIRQRYNMSENSRLFSEKCKIRNNRLQIQASFQDNINLKKKKSLLAFELPKIHSEVLKKSRKNPRRSTEIFQSEDDLIHISMFESMKNNRIPTVI